MTRIYTLVNQKGGVGKTTTAINLGAYLADMGQRTLLVDLDPQANATSCLGIDHRNVELGTYEALIGNVVLPETILHNPKLRLSLLPSSTSLAGAQVEIVGMTDREKLLHQALQRIDGNYDYVLIDCPPSLGLLTLNGLLAAATGVIIPVQCEYLALEGLTQLMQTLRRVQTGLFPELSIRGLLMTMYDGRTNLSKDVVEEVRAHFSGKVFQTIIPRSVRLAEAPSHGLPILKYAPASTGAKAYRRFTEELLSGDGVQLTNAVHHVED
jgi:chromosome partitioning protein